MKHFNLIKLTCLFIVLVLLLPACKKEKTEKEQYEDLKTSLKYKGYKATTKNIVPATASIYHEKFQNDVVQLQENDLHLLLGYNWSATGQAEFAFAEADIVSENNKDEEEIFMAHSLRAITMYQKGWNTLAKEESDLAIKNFDKKPRSTVKTKLTVFHLLCGTLNVYRKDYEQAKLEFAAFAALTGITWPYRITDAMADIQGGDVQNGLKKIKVIANDPLVPEAIRIPLAEALSEVEKTTGDVNSNLFWPRAISGILVKELKKSSDEQVRKFAEVLHEVVEKTNM